MSDEKMTVEQAVQRLDAYIELEQSGWDDPSPGYTRGAEAFAALKTLTAALDDSDRFYSAAIKEARAQTKRAEKAESALADLKAENERLTRAVQGRDDEIEIYKALVQKVKAEREADTERMDFLSKNRRHGEQYDRFLFVGGPNKNEQWRDTMKPRAFYPTLRAAIDAARKGVSREK